MLVSPPGFAEGSPASFSAAKPEKRYQKVQVGKAGRIVIPVAMREALAVKEGDWLLLEQDGQEVRLISYAENLRRIQAYFMKHARSGVSLVDELIEERRAEGTLSDEEFRAWLIARDARDKASQP